MAKEDGKPGVDTQEYMKAVLDYDSEDFEVPTREILMHFSPGQHKSFEFKVIPKRFGERKLSVRLFTTDKEGSAVDDIFDGASVVHVSVGSDTPSILSWLLENWDKLTAIGATLLALWALISKPFRRLLGLRTTAVVIPPAPGPKAAPVVPALSPDSQKDKPAPSASMPASLSDADVNMAAEEKAG